MDAMESNIRRRTVEANKKICISSSPQTDCLITNLTSIFILYHETDFCIIKEDNHKIDYLNINEPL